MGDLERQNKLIKEAHSGLEEFGPAAAMSGHFGRDKCFALLSQRYTFPVMRERISMYIKYCHVCQLAKTRRLQKVPVQMKSIPVPSLVWALVGIDLIGPLKETKNGNKYICSVVDYFTKFVEAFPLQNKTGESVASVIYKLITRYGVMQTTITDQGNDFHIKLSFNTLNPCIFGYLFRKQINSNLGLIFILIFL